MELKFKPFDYSKTAKYHWQLLIFDFESSRWALFKSHANYNRQILIFHKLAKFQPVRADIPGSLCQDKP